MTATRASSDWIDDDEPERGAILTSAIAYGPPGRSEHHAGVARGLIAFGLGVPFGVVFGVVDTIAVDTGRTVSSWYGVAAAALAAGIVLTAVMGRAAVNLGAALGSALALCSLIAAGSWVALFNIGDQVAVDALIAIGLGASVPMLALAAIDALTLQPTARPIAAVGQPAAAAFAGVTVGAFVMFLDPTLVWSDVTAVGGLVALLGALRRAGLPDRLRAAGMAPEPAPTDDSSTYDSPADDSPTGVRVLLAATLGVVAASAVRVGPFLSEQFGAGVRYDLLAIVATGVTGVTVVIGVMWLPAKLSRTGAAEVDDVARLALGAGALMVSVAISQTLPGTVAGAGAASGAALAGIALAAAAGARGNVGRGAVTAAAVSGLAGWTLTWAAWPTLVDAIGSERGVLGLVAVPALAAGAIVSIRPLGIEAPATADPVIDLSAPSSNGRTAPDPTTSATQPAAPTAALRSRSSDVLLDARGVEFSYGSVQVLFGVDLQVRQGEVVALLGTNGAGKTTFLRTVAGLASPSAGSIRMAGGDLAPFSASDRVLLGINQIASGAAVAPDLTVAENLAMFGHTLPRSEAHDGAARALEVFPRLAEREHQRASSLSGGERQMLALSKSLVLRPRLLIIDETTLGLAPVAVAALVPVIRRLHADGASVLLVEQSVHLALDLADRAVCMEKGRIVYESDADELRADPALLEAVYLEGIAAALEHRIDSSSSTTGSTTGSSGSSGGSAGPAST